DRGRDGRTIRDLGAVAHEGGDGGRHDRSADPRVHEGLRGADQMDGPLHRGREPLREYHVFVPVEGDRLCATILLPDGEPRALIMMVPGAGGVRSHRYRLW